MSFCRLYETTVVHGRWYHVVCKMCYFAGCMRLLSSTDDGIMSCVKCVILQVVWDYCRPQTMVSCQVRLQTLALILMFLQMGWFDYWWLLNIEFVTVLTDAYPFNQRKWVIFSRRWWDAACCSLPVYHSLLYCLSLSRCLSSVGICQQKCYSV